MNESFGVALLGCGTVGSGVAQLLLNDSERMVQRIGKPLQLLHVVVRDPFKIRPVRIPPGLLSTDLHSALHDSQVDVVVELVGGTDWARNAVLSALKAGKHVITANKALLAQHGPEIFHQAHESNRIVAFEASVAGGIPIISTLTQGLAANEIQSIQGILNGTSNYILTAMTEHGHDYQTALKEAQKLGYAEADPTLDVDGSDAAHKLAILSRLAFRADVASDQMFLSGIEELTPLDIRLAAELGYVFKLIAEARRVNQQLSLQVSPTLVRRGTPLADIGGANNALQIRGDVVGDVFLSGAGAGMMPTASAVVSDIIDLAVGRAQLTFDSLRLWDTDSTLSIAKVDDFTSRFFLRLTVSDQPGVLAEVAAVLSKQSISVASVIQHEMPDEAEGENVTLVIMSHTALAGRLEAALQQINALSNNREPVRVYRVM